MWDGNQQIIADVIDNQFYEADCYIRGTNLVAKYNYWNGDKSEYTYYTQNAHGDVVNLTDKDGKVTKSYRYDAFGVEKNIDKNDTNAFRYCGEYYDTESGTIYLRARYYDPSIGRFISRDSYSGKNEDPLSLNLYTYCHNNPILAIDPSGHFILTAMLIGAAAGAIIGGTIGGTAAYKSAKEEGKPGSDLFKTTVVGVGKGAVVGGVGGGLIGATSGIVATFGAGSIAGTAAISGSLTTGSKATEVGILQYKKSKSEGKSSSQITRNIVESLFNNGVSIAGFSVASKTGLTTGKYAYGKFDRYVFSKAYNASNRRMPPFKKYLQKPVSTFGKSISYTFVAYNVANTVYSACSKNPEKRASRRGYTLK